jgi:tripartite-type tricarboxylate transporter receptor subunit TctC
MSPAAADDVSDFYKSKRITLVIGYSAGGGYDLYARTVARHMSRHIRGNPTFVPQNMPGAGSRKAGNWLYNVAPKDGTAIATLGQNTPMDQALREKGIRFDVAKFNWIGNPIVDNNITISWAGLGYDTITDVVKKGRLICGGTGATSTSILQPQILNNLLDAKIRIISGYPGGSAVNLAMERGEVNCRGSTSWASMKATLQHWIKERKATILVQWGTKKDPTISQYQGRDVPLVIELAKNDADRRALNMIVSGVTMGRPLVAPPGVPKARVAALRAGFNDTMKDRQFLADAKKQKMDISPLPGEDIQKIAEETVQSDEAVIARAKALIARRDVEKLKKKK